MQNAEEVRQHVQAHAEIPAGAGVLVLGLFENQPSKYATQAIVETAVTRGVIKMIDVVEWIEERPTFFQAVNLIEMWPQISADQSVAVAALSNSLEQLLIDYRALSTGVHGICKRVMAVLMQLTRSDAENAKIRKILWAALQTERQQIDRTHFFAQPLMTWLIELGDTEAFQIEDLEPWEGMLTHWKANGYSWSMAGLGLIEAGVVDSMSAEEMSGFLAQESRGCPPDWMLLGLPRRATCIASAFGLRDNPEFDQLFVDMGRVIRPPVNIHAHCEDFSLLHYACEGASSSLRLDAEFYIDDIVASLGKEFNSLMRRLGRSERAFQMVCPGDWGGDGAAFVCADERRFVPVRDRFRLPFFLPK